MQIEIDRIVVSDRIRKDYGDLEGLSKSIERLGLLQPIVVEPQDGRWLLLVGHRRLKACVLLGLKLIESVTKEDLDEVQRKEIELEENIQRKDLTWQEASAAVDEFHALKQEMYGIATQGMRTDLDSETTPWGMRETAIALDQSLGSVSQDISLAKALKYFPDLAQEKTKTLAIRKLKKLTRRAQDIIRAEEVLEEEKSRLPKLHNKDCFVVMKKMPNESVDFIIADIPWGVDLDKTFTFSRRDVHKTRVKKGEVDTFVDAEDKFWENLTCLLSEARRILRKDRHMILFLGDIFVTPVRKIALTFFDQACKALGIWVKENPGKPHENFLTPQHEVFLDVMKGKRNIRYHGTVFMFPRTPSGLQIHPTQKPVELMEALILTYTVPGEKVFDPMFGSGTSMVAACRTGRLAEGCEIEKTYFTQALAMVAREVENDLNKETND